MKKFRGFFVCFLVIVCAFTLTGCFQGERGATGSQGPKGDKGDKGDPGATITLNSYQMVVDRWNSGDVDKDAYSDDFENYWLEILGLRGVCTECSENFALQLDGICIQCASNLAVRSAVDIRVIIRRGGKDYNQAGAGVIYQHFTNGNAYVITNYHVISKAFDTFTGGKVTGAELVVARQGDVSVYLWGADDMAIPATVIGGSEEHDIAVLSIKGTDSVAGGKTVKAILDNFPVRAVYPSSLMPIKANGQREPVLGEQVIAVGNPLAQNMQPSNGIVSVQSEIMEMSRLDGKRKSYPDGAVIMQDFRAIRTTAAVNPGNSGGGLFNAKAELIGIIQARWFWTSEDDPVDNMAYAIPLDIALRIADQVIARQESGKVILIQKCAYTFTADARDLKVEYKNGHMSISETVYVRTSGTCAGNNFAKDTVIKNIKINEKVYPITRLYQVDDLMIEAYGATKVEFNVAV